MKDTPVFKDERSIAVENASYRWGYFVVTFGLLIIVAVRAFFFNESNWDLMALVIVSGLVTTAFQGYHQLFTRRWIYFFGLTLVIAAGVAALVVFILK